MDFLSLAQSLASPVGYRRRYGGKRPCQNCPKLKPLFAPLLPISLARTIERAEFTSRRVTRGGLAETARALAGRAIRGVRRRGKQIFFDLDRGVLYIHLGMTGKLLWNAARRQIYARRV